MNTSIQFVRFVFASEGVSRESARTEIERVMERLGLQIRAITWGKTNKYNFADVEIADNPIYEALSPRASDPPTDYDLLLESYMPAAARLGLSRGEVADALRRATRFERLCPSCRHSRAPLDAVLTALRDTRLDIFSRACAIKPRWKKCSSWERLELPSAIEEVAA